MLPILTITLMLGALCPFPVHGDSGEAGQNSTDCKHPAPVEAFAASFYTALIVTHDPDVVDGIELTGKEAAKSLYPIIDRILKKQGLCNADWVAWTASRAVALADTLTLKNYWEKTAYDVGQFLLQRGVLNCKNAVSLALEYFKDVRHECEGSDESKFETHMQCIVQGLLDFVLAHHLPLEDSAQELADNFYKDFSVNKRSICKISVSL